MKKGIYTFLAFVLTTSLLAQKEYTLNGSVADSKYDGSVVYLYEVNDVFRDLTTLDSTVVNNGRFSFKAAVVDDPRFHVLSIGRVESEGLSGMFVAEQGTIEVVLDSILHVKGTPKNDEFDAVARKKESLYRKMQELQEKAEGMYKAGNLSDDEGLAMKSEFDNYGKQYTDLNYNYIKNNIKNKLGEYYYIVNNKNMPLKQLEELYELSNEDFRNTEAMKHMYAMIQSQKPKPYNGGRFKDVDLSTPDGKKSSISDYVGKGKVVLIDFWASWCGPCRADMPRLVALYQKYKDRGFEILGISLDENMGSWTKAISSMNMTWPNISDLRGWQSKAARVYDVTRIPQSFLVDKDGNIVGADMKGDALMYKIEELLGNS